MINAGHVSSEYCRIRNNVFVLLFLVQIEAKMVAIRNRRRQIQAFEEHSLNIPSAQFI
jgi:hypothetical protein